MSSRRLVSTLCSLTITLALAPRAVAARPRHAPCPAIAGADAVLRPGARLVFGEVHGTTQTQPFIAALACRAAGLGPVRVGLEISVEEQTRIDAFLASAGSARDREALLAGPFWTDTFQDGLRSQAMLGLLDALRQLRRDGADVRAIAFDTRGQNRDLGMARRLSAAFANEPKATFLILVGNVHARKVQGRLPFVPMSAELERLGAGVTTFDVRYGLGTIWVCMESVCGPYVVGHGPSGKPALVVGRTADGAYDGRFDVGAVSYSPPAAVPPSAEQARRAHFVAEELAARTLYDGGRFAECGRAYEALAAHDAGRRADYAYGAACCFARSGDRERAFAELSVYAAEKPKDAGWTARDPDLAPLHTDPRWHALLERLHVAAPAR